MMQGFSSFDLLAPSIIFMFSRRTLPHNHQDSLGDDLIIEVQDSKGNHYGRVLAQVATISEDPVKSLYLF
ncbi:hypothetical protein L6452_01810 [Arctium lappa]|uniref:Uncharacterized protein n=1 Tax=Arctium lappa TaxID=4217 RepID=A0ACB9FHC8_ARCLA|nr:hypothetical protein L6452_01810 [Arctium lappa]